MEDVKLLGLWASPYVHKVIWALKLKGVEYEYIEEDLSCKSDLLLQSNPVHKKVPVLLHGAKSISESDVILEYIEEMWPNNPLLPTCSFERASARFWINFGIQMGLTFYSFYISNEENREKAIRETVAALKILEEEGRKDSKFFGGDTIGLVDISYGWLSYWFEATQEIVGVKVLEPSTLPRLHAWAQNFKAVPIIRDNLPDYDQLMTHLKRLRQRLLSQKQQLIIYI